MQTGEYIKRTVFRTVYYGIYETQCSDDLKTLFITS